MARPHRLPIGKMAKAICGPTTMMGFVVLAIGLVLAACGNTSGGASPATNGEASVAVASGSTPPPTPEPNASSEPSGVESNLPAACFPPPHEAPDLEAALPTMLAGRPVAIESYHGALMVTCVRGGTTADVAEFADALVAEGLSLDDVSVAVLGRADVQNDPPYFILAYQLTGHPGNEWPPTTGIDNPDVAGFREANIEGKQVLVGETAGVDQTEHAHGRPYVWNSPTVHYLVVTDDESWAIEALRALH